MLSVVRERCPYGCHLGWPRPALVGGGVVSLLTAAAFALAHARRQRKVIGPTDYVAPVSWPWRRAAAVLPLAAIILLVVGEDWFANGPSPSAAPLFAFVVLFAAVLVWSSLSIADQVLVRDDSLEMSLPLGRRVVARWSSVRAITDDPTNNRTTIRLAAGRTFILLSELSNFARLRDEVFLRTGLARTTAGSDERRYRRSPGQTPDQQLSHGRRRASAGN